jgi:hypothetical protein
MLRGTFDDAGKLSATELRSAYDERLVETSEAVGVETVTAETAVDSETLTALKQGESPELTLEAAMTILALDEELPDTDTLLAEARDILLMGMSVAVLDVEAVASGIEDAMEPKEIQQKAEGRFPMTLDEYALLHSYIESKK